MVTALDFGASGPGSSPGRGRCVVFLGISPPSELLGKLKEMVEK